MKSITYHKIEESVADFCSIEKLIIKDKIKQRKQGVADYWIEVFTWYGKRKYFAYIDASWFANTYCYCDSLRDASLFIKKMIYKK